MPGFWRRNAAPTSSVTVTLTLVWISKSSIDLPFPARANPTSSCSRYSGMRPGTKPRGRMPSASSPASRRFASPPVPSQIGSFGFMCRIDFSGLPRPIAPGPVYGSEISRPSCETGSRRSKILRMIEM